MVAASGVIPGRPVQRHWRRLQHEFEMGRGHRHIGAEHQLGIDDGLGHAGGARGEQEFGDGVWPHRIMGGVHRRGFRRVHEIGEERDGAAARRRVLHHDQLHIRRHGVLDGARERGAVGDEDHAGRHEIDDIFQLSMVAGDQRIGRGHRRIGAARIKRAHTHHGVVKIIAREDHEGPLGAEAPCDERRRDAPRGRKGLRIGDGAPCAIFTRGQPYAIRRNLRPVLQPLGEFLRIGVEGARIVDDQRAIGPPLHRRMALTKLRVSKRRVQHQRVLSHPHSP